MLTCLALAAAAAAAIAVPFDIAAPFTFAANAALRPPQLGTPLPDPYANGIAMRPSRPGTPRPAPLAIIAMHPPHQDMALQVPMFPRAYGLAAQRALPYLTNFHMEEGRRPVT